MLMARFIVAVLFAFVCYVQECLFHVVIPYRFDMHLVAFMHLSLHMSGREPQHGPLRRGSCDGSTASCPGSKDFA